MTDKCETHDEAKVCLSCMMDAFHERQRNNFNRMSLARQLMPIQQLPPGALPIYDRDIDVVGIVLGEEDEAESDE